MQAMATPRRIYRIYAHVHAHAAEMAAFESAAGRPVSSTLVNLQRGDRAWLLGRFVQELDELCGVLDGSHDDSYLMEATQTFYWGSLYGVVSGAVWEDLGWDDLARQAVNSGIGSVDVLRSTAQRLPAAGPDAVRPAKLFLLWRVADHLYRKQTTADQQWSLEQLMEADLQEMRTRVYLAPVLRAVTD
jgi:hypothetical protein